MAIVCLLDFEPSVFTCPRTEYREVFMKIDGVTKVLLALIMAGLWANAAAFWSRPPSASAAGPRIVEAEQFVVRDARGHSRAIMAVADTGPYVELYDESGKSRVSLGLADERSILSLQDAQGKAGALLGVTPDGSTLTFRDNGRSRAAFGLARKGSSTISMLRITDENDKAHVSLFAPASEMGKPGIQVQDEGKILWAAP